MMITIDTIDERLAQPEQTVTLITGRGVRSTRMGDLWRRLWIARNHHPLQLDQDTYVSNPAAKNQGRAQINRTLCAELSSWYVCLISNIR